MLQDRSTDVERVYSTPDPQQALSILRKYSVRWVVVGGLERAYYPPVGLAKFETMPELRVAYDAAGVQIFEVQP
jgi:uncharacterized membrane protein